MINTRKKLGNLLVDAGLIDKAQLNNVKLQKTGKTRRTIGGRGLG